MPNLTQMQKQVMEYDRLYGWENDKASHIVIHMMEELGEVSRRVLRYVDYKKEKFNKKEIAEELTDLLYLTLKIANKFDIDLDKEWSSMWKRYEKKVNRK